MSELKSVLKRIVGSENVSDDDYEIICYSRDASADIPRMPFIIVRPRTTEQVLSIIRVANRTRTPVMPWGGASNVVGCIIEGAMILDLTSMNKIVEIDEEAFTVTAQAGITWQELLYELSKEGWTTGPYLHSAPSATVGGSVVLCANGATSAKYGLVGDQVVGLQVVLPSGDILRTGSGANPTARKFIRYCYGSDLTGLFIGSHGLLGVVTEVTLKIYPLPETKAYYGYTFDSVEDASKAMYQIQKRHVPIESMYLETHESLKYFHPDVKAPAALIPIVVEGTEQEVNIRGNVVGEICLKQGKGIDLEIIKKVSENFKYLYFSIADYRAFGKCMNEMPLCSCVPTLHLPRVFEAFRNLCERENIEKYKMIGVIDAFACGEHAVASPLLHYDMRDPESRRKGREMARKVTILLSEIGFAPHYLGRLKGPPEVLWKLGPSYELLRTLKRAMDPNNIMNPGQLLMPEF